MVVCQLPSEAGHPPYIAARLKKPAYGMNDDSRRWWNILDKARRSYGMVPTRADRCCYVLYPSQSRERDLGTLGTKRPSHSRTAQMAPFADSRERSEMETTFENSLDPIAGSPAAGKIRGRNHPSTCG